MDSLEKNSKNPEHVKDPFVSQCNAKCFVSSFATIHCPCPSPRSPVGMFEPPQSWEMGSGHREQGHNFSCLRGSRGAGPIPGQAVSQLRGDRPWLELQLCGAGVRGFGVTWESSGMWDESLMDPSTAS